MGSRADVERRAAEAIERHGFVVVPDALEPDFVEELVQAVGRVRNGPGVRDRGGVYAIRNLLELVPEVRKTLRVAVLQGVIEAVLGRDAFCVRGLFLDKTPRANWSVPWHQDATITVKKRGDATGFGPWTMKAGAQHVMAPPGVLSAMLTIRLHLDDCFGGEGELKAIAGSHEYGRLPEDSIGQFTRVESVACGVPRGGLLAMRPLLVHASDRAVSSGSRRVIQLDFAARDLPPPLEWREAYRVFDS